MNKRTKLRECEDIFGTLNLRKKPRIISKISNYTGVLSCFSIDPGTSVLGCSLLFCMIINGKLVGWRSLSLSHKVKGKRLSLKLIDFYDYLWEAGMQQKYQFGVLEQIFVNKNWSTSVTLASARGVALFLLAKKCSTIIDFHSAKIKRFYNGLIKEEALDEANKELGLKFLKCDSFDAWSMGLIFICENFLKTYRFLNAAQYLRITNLY